jgi:hypothetical protein
MYTNNDPVFKTIGPSTPSPTQPHHATWAARIQEQPEMHQARPSHTSASSATVSMIAAHETERPCFAADSTRKLEAAPYNSDTRPVSKPACTLDTTAAVTTLSHPIACAARNANDASSMLAEDEPAVAIRLAQAAFDDAFVPAAPRITVAKYAS